MKPTLAGKVLVTLFAWTLVALGLYASTRMQPAPTAPRAADAVPVVTPPVDLRLDLIRAAGGIRALDAEIAATESALDVARQEASKRTFSRQDDRERVAALNLQVVRLRSIRAQAVSDYAVGVAAAGSSATVGLPVFEQAGAGP